MEEVMQSAIRITTRVLPNGKIELQLPPESAGDEVEVFVVLPDKQAQPRKTTLEILEEAHKHGPFRTVEEIDHDLRIERDSWDN
jgi:hypothetical protein